MHPEDPVVGRQRHLQLQLRDALSGLADFTLATARPTGWLSVEVLDQDAMRENRAARAGTVVPLVRRRAALA